MDIYSPCKFAALIGVSVRTLQRWDLDGALIAYRNPKGRRYYTYEQYLGYTGRPSNRNEVNEVYFKVSGSSQGLVTQEHINSLKLFCKKLGIQVTELIDTSKNQYSSKN